MQRKIKFVSSKNDNQNHYQPEHKLSKFYQICQFRNPNTSKYDVRIIIFNENQEIVKAGEKQYSLDQCRMLISSIKINEYRMYPTYDLELVDYPNVDDIFRTQSNLMSNNESYSGYASVSGL